MLITLHGFNLSGSISPPLGALTFTVVCGFDTSRLAAGLFIFFPAVERLLRATASPAADPVVLITLHGFNSSPQSIGYYERPRHLPWNRSC